MEYHARHGDAVRRQERGSGFQIILVGGGAATSNVDVRITDLANGSSVIRGSPWSGAAGAGRPSAGYDPFNYLDRDIELFTQQYVNIAKRTDTGGNGWFSSNLPDEVQRLGSRCTHSVCSGAGTRWCAILGSGRHRPRRLGRHLHSQTRGGRYVHRENPHLRGCFALPRHPHQPLGEKLHPARPAQCEGHLRLVGAFHGCSCAWRYR